MSSVRKRLGRRCGALLMAALTGLVPAAGPASAGPGGGDGPDGWAHAGGTAPSADLKARSAKPSGYSVTGIDVSHWQGHINWSDVAHRGAKFAYAKATEGTHYVDSDFDDNYRGAKANGIYAGAYHYARPDRSGGRTQADYFLDRAQYRKDGRSLPPMLDIEWPYRSNGKYVASYPCYGKSSKTLVNWIDDFVDRVKERTGSRTMIYTNPNWWNPCTGRTKAFGDNYLFIANYSGELTTLASGWSRWTLWQYSNNGKLPGDQNVFNGSLSDLAKVVNNSGDPLQYPLVGDWDGNGTLTPGVAVPEGSSWRWLLSNKLSDGPADITFTYGDVSSTPVVGDWDGNRTFTPGTVDNTGKRHDWDLSNTFDGVTAIRFGWGDIGTTPVVGDWNGDRIFTPGLVDNSGDQRDWDLSNSFDGGTTDIEFSYGDITSTPVVGDWDGNGTWTAGHVDNSGDRHDWKLSNEFDGVSELRYSYGGIRTAVVVGDWDGNRTFTPGAVDTDTGSHRWQLSNRHDGGQPDLTFTFGDVEPEPEPEP